MSATPGPKWPSRRSSFSASRYEAGCPTKEHALRSSLRLKRLIGTHLKVCPRKLEILKCQRTPALLTVMVMLINDMISSPILARRMAALRRCSAVATFSCPTVKASPRRKSSFVIAPQNDTRSGCLSKTGFWHLDCRDNLNGFRIILLNDLRS